MTADHRNLVQSFNAYILFSFIDISQAIGLSIESLEESEERLREGACVALTVLQVRKIQPITTIVICWTK